MFDKPTSRSARSAGEGTKLFDVDLCQRTQRQLAALDEADGHGLVAVQRHSSVVVAIEFGADDAGAEGVGVQAAHEIEHGGAIVCLDQALVMIGAEHFLSEVKRVVFALREGKA